MTKQAKRRITKFSFEDEGAHVALVDKAANEQTVLVMKSAKATKEEIQKAVEVNLKLPLMEFLTRYVGVGYDEAEMVAGLLGYNYDDLYNEEDTIESFRDMVQSNMDKVSIATDDPQKRTEEFINSFSEFDSEYFLEKDSQSSAVSQDEDVVTKAEDKETNLQPKEESHMTQETTVQKSEAEIALEKAQARIADLEKAEADLEAERQAKADLQKSYEEMNSTVEVLKAAEEKRKGEEYLAKAQAHTLVITDDNPAEELAKALRIAEETEGCEALVKAFEAYRDTAENGGVMEEIGKSKTDDQPTGSKLDVAIAKAQSEHNVDYMKALAIVQKEQPALFDEEYS